ncbi:MAG: serine/threonine protein kinase [Gemmataceae bacterium]|nr:serine/threonine protein kinase [Gemmataceae bacterium]
MLGTLALGKYRLLRPLGAGSNAAVYLAEPADRPGERVVVKRVRPEAAAHPTFARLFAAEVRSLAGLAHPYIVGIVDAAADDPGGPALVLEYVPGVTLEAVLAHHPGLDPKRVARLAGCLGHGLHAAHAAGVVHRDLKPANLMVTAAGTPAEAVKVMDFGFAGFAARPHLQLADLTGKGPVWAIGTPAYVSPEMIRGDTVDTRSDLYAAGVILFELLTGRLPFAHADQDRLLRAHLTASPPRFDAVGCRHVPAAAEEVVRRALAKYPNERPQTARELAEEFGRALDQPDLWKRTAPAGWKPPARPAAPDAPPPEVKADAPADPYRVADVFEVTTPERLAAAKLKGFVDDAKGQVVASEPGVVVLRLGLPESNPAQSAGGSGLLGWLGTRRPLPGVPRYQEPIEVELHMEKPDPSRARLRVTATCRPVAGFKPARLSVWQDRCDKIHVLLRQYLGG